MIATQNLTRASCIDPIGDAARGTSPRRCFNILQVYILLVFFSLYGEIYLLQEEKRLKHCDKSTIPKKGTQNQAP